MNFRRLHISCVNIYDIQESMVINMFSEVNDESFNEHCLMILRNNGFIFDGNNFGYEIVSAETGEVVSSFFMKADEAIKGFISQKAKIEGKLFTLEIELF